MGQLTFSDIFRYSLPGGVFLAALAFSKVVKYGGERGLFEATVLLALAVVAGALIQSFHRASIFVVVQRLLLLQMLSSDRPSLLSQVNLFSPTTAEIEAYKLHLRLRECCPERAKWLARWADQNHLLWASAWALVFAVALPWWFGIPRVSSYDTPLLITAVALFALAALDSWRHGQFCGQLWKELNEALVPGQGLRAGG